MQSGERVTLRPMYRPHIRQRMHHGDVGKEIGLLKHGRYAGFVRRPQIEVRPPGIAFVQERAVHDPSGEWYFQRTIIKSVQDRMGHTGKVTLVARHLDLFHCQ